MFSENKGYNLLRNCLLVLSGFATLFVFAGCKCSRAVIQDLYVGNQYRCVGTDVTLSYSTSPDTPVRIYINGAVFQATAPGHWSGIIPAAEIDNLNDPEVEIMVEVIASGDSDTETVTTFFGPQDVQRTALPVGGSPTVDFEDVLQPALWDDNIQVNRIRLLSPHTYECPREIPDTTKDHSWQVDKGPSVPSYILESSNNYSANYNNVIAQGSWMYHSNATCYGGLQTISSPVLIYSFSCN